MELVAVAEEHRMPPRVVAGSSAPVIREAEAALAVTYERAAVGCVQLERVEAHQVPVMVRRRVRVPELRDVAVGAGGSVCELHPLRPCHPRPAGGADADEHRAARTEVVDE